jgi:hypothetical protein
MKNYLKLIGVAAFVLATVCVQPAFGNGALVSFLTTNSIDSTAATITSWPTNGTSTNAITWNYTNGTAITTNTLYPGLLTGKAVAIYNQEHLVFNVQGWLVNTGAAATVAFNLTPACTGGNGPAVGQSVSGINTNTFGASVAQNDFETSPANWIVVPIPATTTSWFNYQTNIVMDVVGIWDNADFIGIYQITNNFTATCSLQNPNGVAYLNKKLIPTPLIGQ